MAKGRLTQQVKLGVLLILLSVFFYAVHFLIFRDFHNMMFYLVEDIAFIPVNVLIVTVIIHQVLSYREKRIMLEKLNMVIGAFFSEAGTEMLRYFQGFDPDSKDASRKLIITDKWQPKDFTDVAQTLEGRDYRINSKESDLAGLRNFLIHKRGFFLRLLENPNLLEHESFTELLRAVFHLTDELAHRTSTDSLPEKDYEHLSGDIKRAHKLLIHEWIMHMEHLKENYPYLFSLAVRTNPFNPDAAVEIK